MRLDVYKRQGYDAPVLFGGNILFECVSVPGLTIGVEICEDMWMPEPPSGGHALAGATVIVNPSASDETTGKDIYRKALVLNQSARLLAGYIYAEDVYKRQLIYCTSEMFNKRTVNSWVNFADLKIFVGN